MEKKLGTTKGRFIDFDDKDLAIAGLCLLGALYSIGSLYVGRDPADVLFVIISGVCGLAVGKRKE